MPILYDRNWLTEQEQAAIDEIVQGAIDRLVAKRERNGACPCRCKWPLEDDGSNECRCCSEPLLEMPD